MNLEWLYTQDSIDWPELAHLYQVAPLGEKNPEHLKIAFANSRFKCFVLDQEVLVGAGRVLADGIDCAYICDVAILPTYQGLGIGKQIVSKLLEFSSGHKKILLYSVPGKEPFYKKFGFKRMSTAMAIFENQERAVTSGLLNDT